ncbi:MAG: glycosyltransferase family 39 protein, partial [Acidobacteriia bacterium]|nr:glycosyltransferase family 39 protein [Terriglobia bacterium]
MTRPRIFFLTLFALLLAARMCHTGILWEGEALPMAAAGQMLDGKALYRDIWYDKPPLVPLFHLLCAARPGWALRLEDALYALLCCWVAYRLARDLWSRREGLWAAGLLGFYLVFYIPSALIPAGSDLLLLAPHGAAVWMAHRRRPL